MRTTYISTGMRIFTLLVVAASFAFSCEFAIAAESTSFRLYTEFPGTADGGAKTSGSFSLNEGGMTWKSVPLASTSFQIVSAPPAVQVQSSSGGGSSSGGSPSSNTGGGSSGGGGRRTLPSVTVPGVQKPSTAEEGTKPAAPEEGVKKPPESVDEQVKEEPAAERTPELASETTSEAGQATVSQEQSQAPIPDIFTHGIDLELDQPIPSVFDTVSRIYDVHYPEDYSSSSSWDEVLRSAAPERQRMWNVLVQQSHMGLKGYGIVLFSLFVIGSTLAVASHIVKHFALKGVKQLIAIPQALSTLPLLTFSIRTPKPKTNFKHHLLYPKTVKRKLLIKTKHS
ncbi:hypothetical protein COU76_04235 [Candidatus Peregrinibacteria bacterium CG10_big_fil_rev_8_21_14_0_10_49_10]|nr:MAG: hypothetical protein COU76_04235 [Candidatus Peregrinibacteria bacterium CG10_big_fil_rev_8_21_14_0_10_49_10]